MNDPRQIYSPPVCESCWMELLRSTCEPAGTIICRHGGPAVGVRGYWEKENGVPIFKTPWMMAA
jgi:hypothetical protein